MKKRMIGAVMLAGFLCISGCGEKESEISQENKTEDNISGENDTAVTEDTEYFSKRDYQTEYDTENSVSVQLEGDHVSVSSEGAVYEDGNLVISKEGTYLLSGELEDGMVIVNTEKTEKVQLVLDGVSIHSENGAPLYIQQTDKVFVTLADGSENTLSNGGTFVQMDDSNADAVIFSKEDLTLNGSGSLTIDSPGGHGIVSKDSLTVTGGNYHITASAHGIAGKDDVCAADGAFTIVSGKDGIHGEHTEDETLGFVYIENGSYTIESEGDGISSSSYVQLEGGTYSVLAGGGWECAPASSGQKDDFMGRDHGGPGGHGGPGMPMDMSMNMNMQQDEDETETVSEDSVSTKGIKAGSDLRIHGGMYMLDAAEDGLHANGTLTICDGQITIASGDDGIHADDILTVSGGTIHITESYEGIEALHVAIEGGSVTLAAQDDGINAAGDGAGDVKISGGNVYIYASGDGIDANGEILVSGGYTTVCGPTNGDTATLDYDTNAVITGGTFVGTGAYGMAQSFSDSTQGVIGVSVGNQEAGAEIVITDESGEQLLVYKPESSFAVVIYSSPELVKGEYYNLSIGELSGEVEAY